MDLQTAREVGNKIMTKLNELGFFDVNDFGTPQKFFKTFNLPYEYNYGSTRSVLTCPEFEGEYVIKFDTTDAFAYCETEAYIYEKAVMNGYQDCFAGVWYGGNIESAQNLSIDWYLAEACDCSNMYDYFYDRAVAEGWDTEHFDADECEDDELAELACNEDILWWLTDELEEKWSEKFGEIPDDFCCDCHVNNWGINKNGRAVIVDYAGYSCSNS